MLDKIAQGSSGEGPRPKGEGRTKADGAKGARTRGQRPMWVKGPRAKGQGLELKGSLAEWAKGSRAQGPRTQEYIRSSTDRKGRLPKGKDNVNAGSISNKHVLNIKKKSSENEF